MENTTLLIEEIISVDTQSQSFEGLPMEPVDMEVIVTVATSYNQ